MKPCVTTTKQVSTYVNTCTSTQYPQVFVISSLFRRIQSHIIQYKVAPSVAPNHNSCKCNIINEC